MYKCNLCDYQSSRNYNLKVHKRNKHNLQTGSGSEPMGESIPPHAENEKHLENEKYSNLQEENKDQLYENINQWQKAYETLKLQYQQEEKVTTTNDGRPSHVSIQLYDKCCKGLTDYMHHCQGLINLCQRVHTEKEQQLDRFCSAWEDLKWERDTFAKEINRRDCCGEGIISKKCARKLRKQMLRNLNN